MIHLMRSSDMLTLASTDYDDIYGEISKIKLIMSVVNSKPETSPSTIHHILSHKFPLADIHQHRAICVNMG